MNFYAPRLYLRERGILEEKSRGCRCIFTTKCLLKVRVSINLADFKKISTCIQCQVVLSCNLKN